MARCTHKGCGKEFDPAANPDGGCAYHPGGPVSASGPRDDTAEHDLGGASAAQSQTDTQVFHEGLKSWSCCNEKNKPVMEFDQFMAIPVRRLPTCAPSSS